LSEPDGSYRRKRRCPAASARGSPYPGGIQPSKETPMPVILWLLGVPLGIVLLLMLFGVL